MMIITIITTTTIIIIIIIIISMRLLISGSWVRAPRWALISFAGIVFEAGCLTANYINNRRDWVNLSIDIQ